MLDLLRGIKLSIVFSVALGLSLVPACKSPANQTEADRAAEKKARSQGSGDAASSAASQGRGDSSGGTSASGYPRTNTRSGNDSSTDEENKKETYEGGDPDIFHPPKHAGPPREKIVQGKASTPTPTPNRPIDRPLDPSGKPLTSPTPEG